MLVYRPIYKNYISNIYVISTFFMDTYNSKMLRKTGGNSRPWRIADLKEMAALKLIINRDSTSSLSYKEIFIIFVFFVDAECL